MVTLLVINFLNQEARVGISYIFSFMHNECTPILEGFCSYFEQPEQLKMSDFPRVPCTQPNIPKTCQSLIKGNLETHEKKLGFYKKQSDSHFFFQNEIKWTLFSLGDLSII